MALWDSVDAVELIGTGGEEAERDRHEQGQPLRGVGGTQFHGKVVGAEYEAGEAGMGRRDFGGVQHSGRSLHHCP